MANERELIANLRVAEIDLTGAVAHIAETKPEEIAIAGDA